MTKIIIKIFLVCIAIVLLGLSIKISLYIINYEKKPVEPVVKTTKISNIDLQKLKGNFLQKLNKGLNNDFQYADIHNNILRIKCKEAPIQRIQKNCLDCLFSKSFKISLNNEDDFSAFSTCSVEIDLSSVEAKIVNEEIKYIDYRIISPSYKYKEINLCFSCPSAECIYSEKWSLRDPRPASFSDSGSLEDICLSIKGYLLSEVFESYNNYQKYNR